MDDTSLATLGEDGLIRLLTAGLPSHPDLLVGPGDDCAVVRRDDRWDELLKTDVVVEGIHFLPGEVPERIGRKALARAVSDIAAMGGTPEHALITLLTAKNQPLAKIQEIYRGILDCAQTYGISLAGGETSSLPQGLILNVALTGRVERGTALLRSGARPGDLICVTGKLGDTLKNHHLDFHPRINEGNFLREHALATAMMDLSDGLAKDLPRLCKASGVGCRIQEDDIPRRNGCDILQALSDGEDYELLFTVPKNRMDTLKQLWPEDFSRFSCIGEILPCGDGALLPGLSGGWDHFSPTPTHNFSR